MPGAGALACLTTLYVSGSSTFSLAAKGVLAALLMIPQNRSTRAPLDAACANYQLQGGRCATGWPHSAAPAALLELSKRGLEVP